MKHHAFHVALVAGIILGALWLTNRKADAQGSPGDSDLSHMTKPFPAPSYIFRDPDGNECDTHRVTPAGLCWPIDAGMGMSWVTVIDAGVAANACPPASAVFPPGTCSISTDGAPSCAPGAVATNDLRVLCPKKGSGVTTKTRRCNFGPAFRRRMLAAYDVESAGEFDHRIPLQLGGANVVENVWPEPAEEFHQKDAVEDRLHSLVCSGDISLDGARAILLGDWRAYFESMNKDPRRIGK